jgi:hypothetical protein
MLFLNKTDYSNKTDICPTIWIYDRHTQICENQSFGPACEINHLVQTPNYTSDLLDAKFLELV